MTNNQLTEAELTETLDAATSGYPLTASAEENLRRVFAELQERRKAAMDSEPVGSISIDRLLQLLYQFDGANECAASIGDKEYALECGYVASALRELLSCRSALPVADVVAWSHPNEERKCDIRWRRHDVEPGPLYRHAQPAPVVPEKATVGEMPFLGTSEGAYVRGWNDCRAAMLQESQKSAGASNNCRSSENVQVMQDVSRCSTKAAPALDSPPKTAEARCGNSPAKNSVAPAQSPIDHGYRPGCECSGCKTTVRICAELAGNSPVIPAGYVIVPKEPTKEMIDAGWLHFMGTKNPSSKGTYKAMLAAAPQEVKP